MAVIWFQEDSEAMWEARPLAGADTFRLTGHGAVEPVDAAVTESVAPAGGWRAGRGVPDDLLLHRCQPRPQSQQRASWAVLAVKPGLRVNGEVLRTGIRLLRDRDVLGLPRGRVVVFSMEDPAVATPVTPERVGARCPRCTKPFVAADRVVRCPRCGTAHHLTEALACWTFLPTCTTCDFPTTGGAYPWTPESL